jgi:hypothetical protein
MKKLLLILMLAVGLVSLSSAQTVCTPDSSHFTSGTVVYPATLPCITQGQAYTGTVNIRIPDSLDAHIFFSAIPPNTYYLHVDSVRLDSITGSPAGISAATNPGSGVYLYPGQYGCINFSGITAAAVGSFPVSLYGSGCVHGTVGGFPVDSCQTGLLPPFVNFSLNVCSPPPPPACTPDSSSFTASVNVYPPSLPCIQPGQPYTGTVSLRVPDSLDAHLFETFLPPHTFYLHIDSIRLDSIVGFPAGISGVINPGDSVWLHSGQYGCVQFSGSTNAAPGNYPITIYGRGCVHGSVGGVPVDSCVSGSLAAYFGYSLDVCAPPVCIADTSHFSVATHVYPASLPCIQTGTAFSGQVNIQVPVSLDLTDFISLVPANTSTVYIDSINIMSITGDPAGITSVNNPVLNTWLFPSQVACAVFSGTVNGLTTSGGNYPLTISGTGCGHFTLGGTTIHRCMTNYNFAKVFPYSLDVCYPAGISQISENIDLNIYPNPNQGNLTVTIASSNHISGTMSVLDQLGRVVHTQNIDMTGSRLIPLELGDISAGAYLLMITTGDSRSVKQFIVK